MESEVGVSIKQFARDNGVSDTAVHKAIRAGKISESAFVVVKGKKLLLPSVALAQWEQNFNPNKAQKTKSGKPLPFLGSNPNPPPLPPQSDIGGISATSTAALKNLHEKVKIAKAQIELKALQGEYVSKKDVYDALFSFGQEIRQAFQAIPDRVIDDIIASSNRSEAHNLLSEAINKTLEALSDMNNRDISKRK